MVGVIALALGKHEAEYSSVLEIAGLSGMFAGSFAASGWLYRSAARYQRSATGPPEQQPAGERVWGSGLG